MPTLTITAVTHNSVSLSFAGEAADGTNEIQIGIFKDFEFCVAPVITGIARASTPTIQKLNQATSYYIRVRARRGDGTAEAWSIVYPFRTPVNAAQVTTPAAVMVQPSVVVTPVQATSITSATSVAGYGVDNLLIDAPVAWRSSHATTHTFTARMPPEPIDTVALLQSNIPEDATVLIRVGSTSATADANYGPYPFRASANVPGRPGYHGLFRLPAPVSKEYWRVDITATLPGNLLHLEHAVFGKNRVTKNMAADKNEVGVDLGSLERLRSGNPNRIRGARMRRVDFDLAALTEAQYETQYGDLHWRVGGTDPVLIVPNSKSGAFLHDRILYGAITAGRAVNSYSPYFTRNFAIDSLI